MEQKLKSWSHSRLMDFESCRLKAWLKHGARIPDPRPSPAADRGTAIHTACEYYVQGKADITHEMRHFKDEFIALRRHFAAGNVSLEGEWGFSRDWKPVPYAGAWLRMKADATVHLTPAHGVVVDYKSGKKFGNEIKHGEQLQLYSLAVFLREPKIELLTAELWYLDQNDLTQLTIKRQQAIVRYLKNFDKRGRMLTDCTKWMPTPNALSCKWCPYKPEKFGGTGDCKVGVNS